MSKWGDRKINGPEQVVLPKIYPVGMFWDGKKLKKLIGLLFCYPTNLSKSVWQGWNVLVRRERVNFRTRLSYRAKDVIDIFGIFVFSACLVTVGWIVIFLIISLINKIHSLFY